MLLLELNMPGQSHSMVNRAFVQYFGHKKNDSLSIVCMTKHFDALEITERSPHVRHVPFDTISFRETLNKQKSHVKKFISVFNNLRRLISQNRAHADELVFLSINEYELTAIYFLGKLYPKLRFHTIIHGNMNHIKTKTGRNPFNQFFSFRAALERAMRNGLNAIVLEGWIKNNLLKNYPKIGSNVSLIPHPIDECISSPKLFSQQEIIIAMAGILSPSKNIEEIVNLVNLLKVHPITSLCVKAEFLVYMPEEFRSENYQNLPIKLQPTWLTNAQIREFYQSTDFIIWFHGTEQYYEYSASGILLDAVKFAKPLIALECKALSEFESDYGAVSVSASSVEGIVKKLTSFTAEEYDVLVQNLRKAQQQRLYTNIQFENLCDQTASTSLK